MPEVYRQFLIPFPQTRTEKVDGRNSCTGESVVQETNGNVKIYGDDEAEIIIIEN